jgi:hypothetical protein
MVEMWIRAIKQRFLDAAPIKCVGLDYEFTCPREGRRNQRAAFNSRRRPRFWSSFRADHVPQLLKDFLTDPTIRFCGAAIDNDVQMLRSYKIEISSVYDLQRIVPNPTKNPIPSLYDLSNATIGTKLEKNKRNKKDKKKDKKKDDEEEEEEEEEELIYGWAKVPLSDKQVLYAALDARLGFKIARRHWKLYSYNSHVDHLNIMVDNRSKMCVVWCASLIPLIVILLDE